MYGSPKESVCWFNYELDATVVNLVTVWTEGNNKTGISNKDVYNSYNLWSTRQHLHHLANDYSSEIDPDYKSLGTNRN